MRDKLADRFQKLLGLINECHMPAVGQDDELEPAIFSCISRDIAGSLSS